MKILSASQMKKLDAYTMENEPISSLNLMERTSNAFANWFIDYYPDLEKNIYIFCGTGNNGGDGLAVARLLHQKFYNVILFVCKISVDGSKDFNANLKRLPNQKELPYFLLSGENELPIIKNGIIIDAIFGSGLNRPVEGKWANLIEHLNNQTAPIVSIDIPSGAFADHATESTSIHADHTVSFHLPKLAFLLPENQDRIKKWHLAPIGLNDSFIRKSKTPHHFVDKQLIQSILKTRNKFDHKGTFGHALIIAGSHGKIGAAILATKACLKTGAGLVSSMIPKCGYNILQQSVPEAKAITSNQDEVLTTFSIDEKYGTIGIGPGIGTSDEVVEMFKNLIQQAKTPLVIDADALNIMAADRKLLKLIPAQSILTPHSGEFKRLFGDYSNDFQRLQAQQEIARDLNCYIVLKGAHTCITTPKGNCYFNSTGNPGMATAGSGDVLTGIITSLLSQKYSSLESCILGVYIHGLAGDICLKNNESMESLLASNIISNIGTAFNSLRT